jgi:hypothetical protein
VDDDLSTVKAVQTWSAVVLDLKELEQSDLFGRRADHAQVSVVIGKQDASSGSIK